MVRKLAACLSVALASSCCAGADSDPDAGATAPNDVSLITAADIAREKPADLLEMLKSRVGLDESNSVITMRGVRGIAIFVDGFASSMPELKALKPEQVEKIEILRGAASARFGAEAMGGAIAIATRGTHRDLHASLVQGVDSRRGRYTRLSGGRETDGLGWSLLAEDKTSNGFRTVPDSPFPYQITVADERSKTTLLDGKLGWRGRDLELSLNLKRSDDWAFFGRPAWIFGWRTDNARVQMAWRATNALTLEASLGEERYDSAGVRDRGTGIDAAGLAPEHWLTNSYRQREGTVALAWRGEGWNARAGVNLVDLAETFASADYASRVETMTADSTIRKEALFASAELPVGAGRLELGLRRDFQRYLSSRVYDAGPPAQESAGGGTVKSATSPKVALSWPVDGGVRLRGSFGTGFSPPYASQLYNGYVGAGSVTLANPGLKPERSTTIDLGLTQAAATGDWGLTLFATRWEDKIATRIVDYGTPLVQQPQNVGEVTARGLEVQGSRRFAGGWSASANYTYNRTRIVRNLADQAVVGNELPDMPRHKANLSLAWEPGGDFAVRTRLRAVGSAFTDDANTVTDAGGYRWRKAGFTVLDLAATWRRPSWEFTLALDNALDRDYVSGFFWRQEPRTLRGELTLRY
ncbi:MAG: TonB-dependent receptor [Candidatus Nitricoxidivorans perseverans]|uniref:TonB-dependent receptor n=1 Tax=Candidatus Nitricoxidivorans perseverans TaxID=2975601 RepID=A0AA49IS70_9PROT|nr:MAG: TonB-dependent receptor [Candidatus Nitricoxidivorans perseverans]